MVEITMYMYILPPKPQKRENVPSDIGRAPDKRA